MYIIIREIKLYNQDIVVGGFGVHASHVSEFWWGDCGERKEKISILSSEFDVQEFRI